MKPTLPVAALIVLLAGGAGATEPPAGQAAAATEPEQQPAAEPAAEPAPDPETVPPVPVTRAGPTLLTEELKPGFGAEARAGMNIAVHYTGWLYDANALGYRGKKFDSSRDRGQPFVFMLGAGRVIRGWEIGVTGMRIGGLRRLVIPPELGYGARAVGNGLIPANSTLVFEVELLGIESNTVTPQSR